MRNLLAAFGYLFGLVFALAALSASLNDTPRVAAVFVALALLCLPFAGRMFRRMFGRRGWIWRGATALVAIAGLAVTAASIERTSIYGSPEIRARFHAIYAEKLAEWPVPYEEKIVGTRYGPVHVIASGAEDAPPLLLLHASGVAGWSWKYNAEELSRNYRIYAIDLISDAGLSEYADLSNRMRTGKDEADHYAEVATLLGVMRAPVVGASEGGFIATNYALHYPERVEKLVLLGPMGYSGATRAAIAITLAQLFPVKPVQDATFRWAFSDSAKLRADYAEWFPLLMSGTFPAKVAPWPFSAEERQALSVPTLFVFGTRDNVVGDPEAARASVADVPDARVEVIEAGHLMAAERPEAVNALILGFLGED
ncbi:alpha/beta fold hydrolase [Ostreiculturibacter nitratireducens]|uniref:alpha/beta fold hydrolase n=1 Tax=Ostreiculturibacter nitratireducens TaxID=3075226 RepID=UPI0031B56D64